MLGIAGGTELALTATLGLLLFGNRLLPSWGSALGETVGEIRGRFNE